MTTPTLDSIYTGRPKSLCDERGEWTSSIQRDRITSPISVTTTGLEGDQVAQPYHGSPDAALCVHLCDHYRFWSNTFAMSLAPGSLGENLALDGITEEEIFAGDIIRIGTSILQVSGPRVPCANQARHVGRTDWVKLTIRENRTGFYMRVLQPGTIVAGDRWELQQRLNPTGSIPALNRCFYLDFDPPFAQQTATLEGLGAWWKQQFQEKLLSHHDHWSQTLTEGS